MKIIPNLSYEFNCALNDKFSQTENIKNFASIISDKDRFFPLLENFEKNKELIEKKLGYKMNEKYDFFIVRAEKFKSFSLPITIEYSICPEEMFLFLFKEIIKITCKDRFIDQALREIYINSFVENIMLEGDFGKLDYIKFLTNLHDESKKNYDEYKYTEIDFSKKTLKDYIFELGKEYEEK